MPEFVMAIFSSGLVTLFVDNCRLNNMVVAKNPIGLRLFTGTREIYL